MSKASMDEEEFWKLIEAAWKASGGYTRQRKLLAQGKLAEEKAFDLQDALDDVVAALTKTLERLTQDDLLAFDRILEKKLYDIDRAEIQAVTDGSDDGFLYARGFIVAMGREVYEAVNADPAKALTDFECEEMCYLSVHLYEEKFGEMPASGISRESASNASGW